MDPDLDAAIMWFMILVGRRFSYARRLFIIPSLLLWSAMVTLTLAF
jgi:hypothetical protein